MENDRVTEAFDIYEFSQVINESHEPDLRNFFRVSLFGYYYPLMGGLTDEAGDIVYRLADFIEPSERKNTYIYPTGTGSLVIPEYDAYHVFDSLEDWRAKWEEYRGAIPTFQLALNQSNREQKLL